MKIREISYAALRLMAVWLFISITIPSIWGFIFYLSLFGIQGNPNKSTMILLYSSQFLISTFISLILWFYSESISWLIYNDETELESNYEDRKIIVISLIIIGAYLIVSNLPGLISNTYSAIAERSISIKNNGGVVRGLIQNIVAIILGFICITGKIDIVGLLNKSKSHKEKSAL